MITGYLGSGKTTVLNELLKSQTGERLAIIVNDLGSINIDASVIKKNSVVEAEAKMIEMTNGCICCTLQEAFMEQIERLVWYVGSLWYLGDCLCPGCLRDEHLVRC